MVATNPVVDPDIPEQAQDLVNLVFFFDLLVIEKIQASKLKGPHNSGVNLSGEESG